MGQHAQLFPRLLLRVQLVEVEVVIEHRDQQVLDVLLKIRQLLELLIDFSHLLQQDPRDVILVLGLRSQTGTILFMSGLSSGRPSGPSCSMSMGKLRAMLRLDGRWRTSVLSRAHRISVFCRGGC